MPVMQPTKSQHALRQPYTFCFILSLKRCDADKMQQKLIISIVSDSAVML